MSSEISAEAFLRRLAERGVDYIFANAGTDFAPIIEAIARNHNRASKYPRAITVPHENVAMAMAHGYYRASGKPACVPACSPFSRSSSPAAYWPWLGPSSAA